VEDFRRLEWIDTLLGGHGVCSASTPSVRFRTKQSWVRARAPRGEYGSVLPAFKVLPTPTQALPSVP